MTRDELFKRSPEPWKPDVYQKKAVKFLLEHAAAALFLEPGLGKTTIALAALKVLRAKQLVDRALIVAPLRVCVSVWPKEIAKWSDFADTRIVVLHGKDKEELLKTDADVYVINPEGLEWLLGVEKERTPTGKTRVQVNAQRWKELDFDTLIVDELSKFKYTSTQRFKALKHVLGSFRRRWGMTGSPSANSLIDLFGQMYVLDEGRSLGRFVTHYRKTYFDPSWDGFSWDLKPGAEPLIHKRIKPLTLAMKATDYIDLPLVVNDDIRIDLPPQARKAYDELERDLILELDEGIVVASNAAGASLKCRQVASGGVYVDDAAKKTAGRTTSHLHMAKVEALADLVDELQGAQVLVAYEFQHDLERIRMKLGKDVPHIGGGVTAKRSAELVDAWNAGELRILCGHPLAIGHGLNLQGEAHHIVWHSPTWNYELYEQFNYRIRRRGSKAKRVFIHHIVARDTVDEDVMAALRSKRKGQEALFDAMKTRLMKRRK